MKLQTRKKIIYAQRSVLEKPKLERWHYGVQLNMKRQAKNNNNNNDDDGDDDDDGDGDNNDKNKNKKRTNRALA